MTAGNGNGDKHRLATLCEELADEFEHVLLWRGACRGGSIIVEFPED